MSSHRKKLYLIFILIFAISFTSTDAKSVQSGNRSKDLSVKSDLFQSLEWRNIGPANMGGRITDIEGVPGNINIVYIGTACGGIWKTKNGGITWTPIFDTQPIASIGDIALEPANPDVIYVGTGESNVRNSVSFGNGVYKSTDGGRTWRHLGLDDSRHISRIVINPQDPKIVYVGVLGHIFGPNKKRGVFKSTNGGETWEKALFTDDHHGVADMDIDPQNPNIVYAALWHFERKPWTFTSGDKNGGVYRSLDGGRSWAKLTVGLPKLMGRIGIKVSWSNPEVVYVIAESKEGALFRSDDGGESFQVVSKRAEIVNRGFYYSDLRIDPIDENRVYALATRLFLSIDGGKKFNRISHSTHVDFHSLWIDPENPNRIWQGQDGGIAVSYDKGKNWERVNNFPAGLFYQIYADNRIPFYYVGGGMQDNSTWYGPSRTREPLGILNDDWRMVSGGDGFHIVVHPDNQELFLSERQGGKSVMKTDMRTREQQIVSPEPHLPGGGPASNHKYRFNWNAPIIASPYDKKTIYIGGNVLFKSTDFGSNWEIISPDLTTNDPDKQQNAGGPIIIENSAAEFHCTITSLAESPVQPGVLWAGTDDGNIQLSLNGGDTWKNLVKNVPELPPFSPVSHINPSRISANVAYCSFDRHMLDDPHPYLFKTIDFGKHWVNITDNIPENAYIWVVREDPKNTSIIYVGTELGIYVSLTGGKNWIKLHLKNLPTVAVHDILIHPQENDLIIGTHGRSMWILDDISFLQEITSEIIKQPVYLFTVRPALRYTIKETRYDIGDKEFRGPNPPYGAIITYYLKQEQKEATPFKLEILDKNEKILREMKNLPGKAGVNRLAWDLRDRGPRLRSEENRREARGSQVLPGHYKARLIVGENVYERPFEICLDPTVKISEDSLLIQRKLILQIQETQSYVNDALRTLDILKVQLESYKKNLLNQRQEIQKEIVKAFDNHLKKIESIQNLLSRPEGIQHYGRESRLVYQLRGLLRAVDQVNAVPTKAQFKFFDELREEFKIALAEVNNYLSLSVKELNETLYKNQLPKIIIPEPIKLFDI